MNVPRGTETGDAPGWQGARSENTGQYLNDEQRRQAGVPDAAAALGWRPGVPDAAAALGWRPGVPDAAAALGWRPDAAPVECSGTFTTGC